MAKPSVSLVIGLGILAVIGLIGFGMLNDSSMIPHRANAYLYFAGDWLIGESKECRQGLPLIHLFCGKISDEEMSALFNANTKQWDDWDDSRFHNVPVLFWGDPTVNDPNRSFLTWRCERRDSDFKCWRTH
jgi:hypothetical protein